MAPISGQLRCSLTSDASIAAAPSPHRIAEQIYTQGLMTKMIVRYLRGEKLDAVLSYAESEIEGYMRT